MKRMLLPALTVTLSLFTGCTKSKDEKKESQPVDSGFTVPETFDDLVIGEYEGKTIRVKDVNKTSRQVLWTSFSGFHRLLETTARDYAEDQYFLKMANSDQEKKKALLDEARTVPEVTDAEVKSFYDLNKARIPYPFETIKDELKTHLKNDRKASHREELSNKVATAGGFKPLDLKVKGVVFDIQTSDFPSRGSVDAQHTLIEFADFTCPHCKKSAPIIKKLLAEKWKNVRFVYRYFPRDGAKFALESAVAGRCAHLQDKFWEFHDAAYGSESLEVSESSVVEAAAKANLDTVKWQECRNNPETQKFVVDSKKEALAIGVTSTPTFFLNGTQKQTDDELTQLMEEMGKLN